MDRIPRSAIVLAQVGFIVYGPLLMPPLPKDVLSWATLAPVRILVLVLIAYMINHDPAAALAIGLAMFTITAALDAKARTEKADQILA